MKLKTAFFLAKDLIAAFCDIKLEASNLAATKPKDVFGKIKRQECSLGTKKGKVCSQKGNAENSVTLLENERKRFFSKIK